MDNIKFIKESTKDFKKPINIVFLILALYPIITLRFPTIGFSIKPIYLFSISWFFIIITYILNTFNIKKKHDKEILDLQEDIAIIFEIIQYRNKRYWEIFNGNPIWQGNQPKVFNALSEFHLEKEHIKMKLQERYGDKLKVKELEDLISKLYTK